jgi:hypothetical protein
MMTVTEFAAVCAVMIGSVTPAFAICAGNQIDVFSCSFGAKQVELCMTPDDQSVTYRFGPKAAPELEIARSFDEITMQPWNGIGRSIWETVSVPNGQFSYAFYTSFDKFDQTLTAELEVKRKEQTLARLTCNDTDVGAGLFELDTLTMTMLEVGYCRTDTSDVLRAGPCE